MLGSKASEKSLQFDTFDCLKCGSTITFAPPAEASKLGRSTD
jgi:hypothetical protein